MLDVLMTPVSQLLASRIADAARAAAAAAGWPGELAPVEVERPANPTHGDYATNLAMRMARVWRRPPLEIARAIAERVERGDVLSEASAAAPGFVNFRLRDEWVARQTAEIVSEGPRFAGNDSRAGRRIQVEFISGNPTGPLSLANARGGPIGDVLAAVFEASGAVVEREYYVEDTGTQFEMFGRSIAIRYRQLLGEEIELPADGYPGEYMVEIAKEIQQRDGDAHRALLLEEQARRFVPVGLDWVLRDVRRVTEKFGIRYDHWFMQSEMMKAGHFDRTLEELRRREKIVEKDGAIWFTAEEIADDGRKVERGSGSAGPGQRARVGGGRSRTPTHERAGRSEATRESASSGAPSAQSALQEQEGWVVVRSNGEPTYFGKDIAYHRVCLTERGLDVKVDIWGANTHYHLVKMREAMAALGLGEDRWSVVLYQFVRFLHEGAILRMSRRHGQVISLEDVLDAVGRDVTRFFLLQRSADAPLDFDFELALQHSNDNPVYYAQYAHARICSIFRTARERGIAWDDADVALLTQPGERELILACLRLPDLVAEIGRHHGVHMLTQYALELAGLLHSFYKFNRVVGNDVPRTRARLRLMEAVQVALGRTLGLLGINAPESM